MQGLILGVAAAFVGILLGFWLRGASGKAEKTQLEQRAQEQAEALSSVRLELMKAQGESAARAGFESLAIERLRALADRTTQIDLTNRQMEEKDREILRLSRLNGQHETDLANERGNGERLTQQFKVLANEILKENSKVFTEQNKESLAQVLTPLTRDLSDFRLKVEAAEKDSLVGRTQLTEQLKGLESLNRSLSDEAHNLATALRQDTKKQGNWGETILLNILENSGLEREKHFTFQQSFVEEADEDEVGQRRQTDVVVKLPGGRHLIIDSKVSTNAYTDSIKAENEEDRESAVKRHLASIRKHYNELAGRNYQHLPGMQTPDFVVMFVPIEPAFMLAMQQDDGLWLDAYRKGVLFAGPTTVLFVIRIVENLWNQDRQSRNVDEVMGSAAELYKKFASFINDMEDVGKNLRGASQSYAEAKKKLSEGSGNLIRQVENLRKLGVTPKLAKSAKPIPLKWLTSAGLDDDGVTLAAASEDDEGVEGLWDEPS